MPWNTETIARGRKIDMQNRESGKANSEKSINPCSILPNLPNDKEKSWKLEQQKKNLYICLGGIIFHNLLFIEK